MKKQTSYIAVKNLFGWCTQRHLLITGQDTKKPDILHVVHKRQWEIGSVDATDLVTSVPNKDFKDNVPLHNKEFQTFCYSFKIFLHFNHTDKLTL